MAAFVFREHTQAIDASDGSEQAHIHAKISYTTRRDTIQMLDLQPQQRPFDYR
ncbi:hypothetical protein ABT025_32325 [Streptomyces sp. NPDC002809]|uniref:hypothetical protein n=1 Tax=Streptomyces sp. NPDC002809 TaxID=3154433 RepID=UPI003321E45D